MAPSVQGSYHGNTSAWLLWPWERIQTVATYDDDLSTDLLQHAASNGATVSLAMGGPDDSGAPNATVRAAWIAKTVKKLQSTGATGINMDVEAVMKADSANAAALSALLSELASALQNLPAISGKAKPELSFDAAARPCYEHRCYNYSAIAHSVDRIFVMDYDLNDYNDPPPDNDHSRANAPLPTVEAGLKQLLATPGVTAEKLVLGLPWYGYIYYTLDGHVVDNDQIGYGEIEPMLSNASWEQRWDAASQTPVLMEKNAAAGAHEQEGAGSQKPQLGREIWYDNPRSLQLKVAMAKALGIRRFGCWTADALDYNGRPEAAKAMWDAMQ